MLSLILGLSLGFILANISFRFAEGRQNFNLNLQTQAQINSADSPHKANKSDNLDKPSAPSAVDSESGSLSINEVQQAIKKADQDVDNLQLQRDLGTALFRYSALEHRADFLPDAIRLMERADQKTFSEDKELHETLGNALFVEAQQVDSNKMSLARQSYQKALQIEPNNADLIVNIGLTYFFEHPSNPAAALTQYNQALKIQPRNEKALENLIVVLLALKQSLKANERFQELRQLNPDNQSLTDLQSQVNQALLNNH